MTQAHKLQAQRRMALREDNSIWWMILMIVGGVVVLSLIGWMKWSDQPQTTAPVSIERAVESGGLVIEN